MSHGPFQTGKKRPKGPKRPNPRSPWVFWNTSTSQETFSVGTSGEGKTPPGARRKHCLLMHPQKNTRKICTLQDPSVRRDPLIYFSSIHKLEKSGCPGLKTLQRKKHGHLLYQKKNTAIWLHVGSKDQMCQSFATEARSFARAPAAGLVLHRDCEWRTNWPRKVQKVPALSCTRGMQLEASCSVFLNRTRIWLWVACAS